jgi:hypothetical protein
MRERAKTATGPGATGADDTAASAGAVRVLDRVRALRPKAGR